MDRAQRKEQRRRRFIALIEERYDGNQARFEDATGIAASLASRYISGAKGIGEDMRDKIELQAGVPGWFGERTEGAAAEVPVVDSQLVVIDQMNISASMGFGEALAEHEEVVHRITLDMGYVRKHMQGVSSPANLRVISGHGNSMAPTINDGDLVLVDTGIRAVKIDGIYVLSANERLYIKSVRQRMDGQYEIYSDNPSVKTVDVLNGDHEVTVHGRVVMVWNGKRV